MEPTQPKHACYPEFNEPNDLQPPPPPPRPRHILLALILLGCALVLALPLTAYFVLYRPHQTISPTAILSPTPPPTNTPTANPNPSYTAQTPGPKCDTGTGQWTINYPITTETTCSPAGLTVTNPPNAPSVAEVTFQWPGHAFPDNYAVDVDISNLTSQICAGIMTRKHGALGGYGLYICSNGTWKITRYAEDGSPTPIRQGNVPTSDKYHIHVIASGTSQGIAINNGNLNTITDATYSDTEYIALAVDAGNGSGSATFSNFIYTP